ncbi:hypothetical protein SAMD00019534_107440 [Acytostelium subglobosum LB1]|uniref:hypothetical protein n=1 Tax=Acytostelium subglobosum LB1 TaxID=1410327 RepID=UPI000644FB15|nr:hypothetical protein SAMD00019534_107440 [Acytostelium subglobosum LB1]GAM27568.1 hypothetical protein SAMD00019534_107440 [Acytostelium subglobosum LB1]|eukprot:XP_012749633.1 hypothetical protein SAMD00019534_107440 [Acytostelium subglobosum LB1]
MLTSKCNSLLSTAVNSSVVGLYRHFSVAAAATATASSEVEIATKPSKKSKSIKVTTFSTMTLNQHVTFTPPVLQPNGTVIVGHTTEEKPFVPLGLPKRVLKHELTQEQLTEIQKLRDEGWSQKKLAEKFSTTAYIIARVSHVNAATKQKLIDNFQIKAPKEKVDVDERKQRVSLWLEKNQQREYDEKVLRSARGYEDIKMFRRAKHEYNYMANQETYDAIIAGQEMLKPKITDDDAEEKKRKKEEKKDRKSTARRRAHISDKEKSRVNKPKKAKDKLLSMMDE